MISSARFGIRSFRPLRACAALASVAAPLRLVREVRHVIQRELEPPLARLLLAGTLGDDDLVRARVRGDRVAFAVER